MSHKFASLSDAYLPVMSSMMLVGVGKLLIWIEVSPTMGSNDEFAPSCVRHCICTVSTKAVWNVTIRMPVHWFFSMQSKIPDSGLHARATKQR